MRFVDSINIANTHSVSMTLMHVRRTSHIFLFYWKLSPQLATAGNTASSQGYISVEFFLSLSVFHFLFLTPIIKFAFEIFFFSSEPNKRDYVCVMSSFRVKDEKVSNLVIQQQLDQYYHDEKQSKQLLLLGPGKIFIIEIQVVTFL